MNRHHALKPEPHHPVPGMAALIRMHSREWRIVERDVPKGSLFVMDDQGALTGPYGTTTEAWDFITGAGR